MYGNRTRDDLSRCIAGALLAGVWTEHAMIYRADRALDRRCRWMRPLVREVLEVYPRAPADSSRTLAQYIDLTLAGLQPRDEELEPPKPRRWYAPPAQMGRRPWAVPEIATVGDLARLLGVSDGELAWLADTRTLERTAQDERLRNYRYGTFVRPGRPVRVIERPKHRLKEIQRRLLHDLIDWIPAHENAHGFTRGRSVRTHANRHAGQAVVIRIDLQDFFASITASRVFGIFRTAGYPEPVAYVLTALCTNAISASFWSSVPPPQDTRQISAHHRLGRQLAIPHLPQGAPTSPALANLAAFRLDRRLSGLAGRLESTYTRYADDLTFSGPERLNRQAGLLRRAVAQIAREEGFTVNEPKSTLVTQAGRQRICGVVVNQHPNVSRDEYDLLKAIIHNAVVHGPASQNRAGLPDFRAHLLGRIAWASSLNPRRGAKLSRDFAMIAWPGD